jgi:hypothetical protein
MKHVLTFEDFLLEYQLNEIGDSNLPPYKWEKTKVDGSIETFEFLADKFLYQVDLSPFKNGINVTFSANGSDKITTNQGNQYRIMSTVIDIVKEKIKTKPEINKISFVPNEDFKNDNRRLKLYIAYIEKQFSVIDTKIDQFQSNKVIEITIKR